MKSLLKIMLYVFSLTYLVQTNAQDKNDMTYTYEKNGFNFSLYGVYKI